MGDPETDRRAVAAIGFGRVATISRLPCALCRALRSVVFRCRRLWYRQPPRRWVRLARRIEPVRREPFARGTPIDRYYIARFFTRWNNACGGDILGTALEFYDTRYLSEYGGWGTAPGRVERADVIDIVANPRATIRADITDAPDLPSASYDTIVCTQVLQYVPEPCRAIATLRRLLRPSGVLYLSVPGIAPNRGCVEGGGVEYSRFTSAGVRRMLEEQFASEHVVVEAFGNVLAAVGFLHGLAADEFTRQELDFHDESFEVLIAARVRAPDA
jgi:SAM-dependent methyltransferase